MFLSNKTILLISPEQWGTMFISKHHYAIELAKLGNSVYFISSPKNSWHIKKPKIEIEKSEIENLFIIQYSLFFPYNIKFHFFPLYKILMRLHIQLLKRKVKKPFDIIWSFDFGNSFPLSFFKNSLKIFHPVDDPKSSVWAIQAAESANIILSVTNEILEKYKFLNVPSYFINHGISSNFLKLNGLDHPANNPIKVGYSGNLLRKDIDYIILCRIIKANPDIRFHFWGSYLSSHSNFGGSDIQKINDFINELRNLQNVILHGPIPSESLAVELIQCDAFIICYDIKRDPSNGTNYHKAMEYLSTGKVLISNNITTYKGIPGLIEMVDSRENNAELPELFKKIINNIAFYNSTEFQKKRIEYARNNSYSNNILKIDEALSLLE